MTAIEVRWDYWCRPCHGWWDAEIPASEREHLAEYQRSSYARSGEWRYPGRSICPRCGLLSTQYLPTERWNQKPESDSGAQRIESPLSGPAGYAPLDVA